jgi:hypothetical protein
LSDDRPLNGFTAAVKIFDWLEFGGFRTLPIDLNRVRTLLPETPLGFGTLIKPPTPLAIKSCEGALVRNPHNENEWGIFYNPASPPERQRFTVAHELGHFILHRTTQSAFNCDKESIYAGTEGLKQIEREADDFASNLLMPGDLLRNQIAGKHIDFHLLGVLAKEFGVSLEAMCIRFVKYTEQRAVLIYWDNGFLKYQWRSKTAAKTGVKLRKHSDPQEPSVATLAADDSIAQEWDGIEMPANRWCSNEPEEITLRELKHTWVGKNRVLSLLILESAAPRPFVRSCWEDEKQYDSFDRFVDSGQLPVR